MKFVVLGAIVNSELESKAIDIAKEAGAGGVTAIHGKHIGLHENKAFFGLTVEDNVSVLVFILPKRVSMMVLKALKEGLDLYSKQDNGVAFTIPLEHVTGIDIHELHKFDNEIKKVI
jgi:hypothetical protein